MICSAAVSAQSTTADVAVMYGIPAIEVTEINLGNIKAGEETICGCALYNKGTSTLEISDVIISDMAMKGKTSLTYLKPQMKIGFNGKIKFKSAIGKFRITVKIYYKNIREPTIATFTGKVIE